ncbi:MAG: hypothetical protein ACI9XO_003493 [Paraglaciecola sp.]|jgi:hypothetical protein
MKILFTIFSFLYCCSLLQAQIIFQEDFENGAVPTDWTITTNATDAGWNVGTAASLSSQAFPIVNNGSTNVAATNDDACNCDKSEEYFITPNIDLTDQTVVVLKFDAFYLDNTYQGIDEDVTIEISLDGINWTVLEDLHGHGSWDTHIINLSDYAGESSVQIGFRYDDGGGWLYGFAIDNISVEVPLGLDANLVEINQRAFGETDLSFPLGGIILNDGATTITDLEVTYILNGGTPVVTQLTGVNIEAFDYYTFDLSNAWTPNMAGEYTVDMEITAVNGGMDENPTNNSDSFETEIFAQVTVPNKIEEFLVAEPVITELTAAGPFLNKPTDLDFFPVLGKDELWVVNQRTEGDGGSTLTIADATADPSDYTSLVDGNAWHFMSLPTAIAFSDDNYNFGTSPGVQDANHNGGTFTGPTLWSSDLDIYAQPSGGNGSHLDMLHGSPFSMGIAHEVDNVFWVYDDWNKDIVRYDFVEDHGPGNDDHADGMVRRYENIGINADADIPNHMIVDKATGWLYFVDNGNDRVLRLDINSATGSNALPGINEPLAEHSSMTGFNYEVIIETDLERPCGIEIFENYLLVGDYDNGDIVIYDMEDDFLELGRIATLETGLTGIKVGPDGNIWYTNRLNNTLMTAEPGDPSSTTDLQQLPVTIYPNPTNGIVSLNIPQLETGKLFNLQVNNSIGQTVLVKTALNGVQDLNLENLPNGIYLLNVQGDDFFGIKKVLINH